MGAGSNRQWEMNPDQAGFLGTGCRRKPHALSGSDISICSLLRLSTKTGLAEDAIAEPRACLAHAFGGVPAWPSGSSE